MTRSKDFVRPAEAARRPAQLPTDLTAKAPEQNISAEVASWLEPMLSLLPEEDRKALRLADFDGMSLKDLAARLGISVTAAKSRMQRARRRLKKVVHDCCHIEMDRRGNAVGYTRKGGSCGACSYD